MQSNKPPRECAEIDNNRLGPAQELAAVAQPAHDGMEADKLLIEARPFLQVLASIITRLYGERREEPPLKEQGNSEQSNE